MAWKDYKTHWNNNGEELIKTILYSIITALVILTIMYFARLRTIDGFIPKYGFFLFFASLSYALMLPSIKMIRSYKEYTCMSGMMIGMTIGMISGFLAGYYVGATNGMFWGSMFGMGIGIFFGIWNGKCCGIMGIMEGMMAGFMGGLMGAMTAVMMFNDHLKAAGVIVFVICGAILFGLNYMVYKETKHLMKESKDTDLFTIVCTFVLIVITTIFITFGPRSPLFT